MRTYIAVIHKEAESSYGVSFPDVPGVVTAGDTLDDALTQASDVLAFAAVDWTDLTGNEFPLPRTLQELRADPGFVEMLRDAVVAAIPLARSIRQAA